MYDSIITGLLHNTAILLAFSMLYDSVWMKLGLKRTITKELLIGTIIGGIGIVLMLTPWTMVPGIVFDTRSVMLSMSGLFFGPLPTIVAMIINGIFRFSLGGGGMWMGVGVIICSGTVGILWRKYRHEWWKKHSVYELLGVGVSTHILMLLCVLLLPKEMILTTFRAIIIPLVIVYPVATILLGLLMIRQFNNWKNRKAKEELKESERRLSEILKSSNLVAIILDKDFNIAFCNQYFLNITGYNHEEIIGKQYLDFFIKSNNVSEVKNMLNCFIKGDNSLTSHENSLLTRDGRELTIAWENSLLVDKYGNFSGISAIGVNITTQRNYELSLLERNETIARQNESFRQLNEELQKAKVKAEESNRLKSAFLANMSHEIRTPMNGVLGFADLLKEPELTGDEQKTYISLIEKSGHRLLGIINDIVDISKIESGHVEIIRSSVNIRQMLDELEAFFKPEAEKKGLLLSASNSTPGYDIITEIYTDKEKIYAILTNLIKNAIKYSDKGKIEVRNYFYNSDVHFIVKDEGVGIDKDYLHLVFERFAQESVTGYRKHEGAGLGLAISKAYVEMLGGKIWVESEKNIGSTFSFTIPVTNCN